MEFPLDWTTANRFLCQYEKKWLNSCAIEFKPKVYKGTWWYLCNGFTFEIEDRNSFFIGHKNYQKH